MKSYPICLKKQVLHEVEKSPNGLESIIRRYGISSMSTIKSWIRDRDRILALPNDDSRLRSQTTITSRNKYSAELKQQVVQYRVSNSFISVPEIAKLFDLKPGVVKSWISRSRERPEIESKRRKELVNCKKYSLEFKRLVVRYKLETFSATDSAIAMKFGTSRENVRNWWQRREFLLSNSPKQKKKRARYPLELKKEVLLYKMNHPVLTYAELSSQFGVPASSIQAWTCDQQRILELNQNRPNHGPVTHELVALYRKTHPEATIQEIAEHFEIPWTKVYNWLRSERGSEADCVARCHQLILTRSQLRCFLPGGYFSEACVAFLVFKLQDSCDELNNSWKVLLPEVFKNMLEKYIHGESIVVEPVLLHATALLIPIGHVHGLHWSIVHVDMKSRTMVHYNPHINDRSESMSILQKALGGVWSVETIDSGTQSSGADSGVVMIYRAMCLLLQQQDTDVPTSKTLSEIRRRLVNAILHQSSSIVDICFKKL